MNGGMMDGINESSAHLEEKSMTALTPQWIGEDQRFHP
jgi:hypothetical protein